MAREIAVSSSATQTEPKRPLMPYKLLKAAIDGNETDLRQLLGLNNEPPPHTNVDVQDGAPTEPSQSDLLSSVAGMENTILHILSANDHRNLVSTICMKDSSLLKARNVRNETPFHHAARFGNINTILELIHCAKSAFGEDGLTELLRRKNCLGETALHEAARHDHGSVVSTLMDNDRELAGLVNNNFVSPLYLATAKGSLKMVKNMVAKMLDHEITSEFYSGPKKQTALHAAVLQDQELTQALLQLYSAPHFNSGPKKQTALDAAVLQDQELTKELLQLYSEPLGKGADETGRTPLHFVASTGNHKIAELLLDKDPSLAYTQDSDGSFPVHTAVRMGHVKMIVLFLQRCLDSGELLDHNGRNFLHIAIEAKKGHIILELLKDLKNKLLISHWERMFKRMANTIDNKENTPLHLAAEHDCIDVMLSFFKKKELDLTLQNKEGLTAADISVIRFREAAMNFQGRWGTHEVYIPKRKAGFSTGWFQYYTKEQMPKTELSIKDQVPEIEAIRGTMQDHILTADARVTKRKSESVMAKAQLVGLGSVLIATVTFAAAFTLPGGTSQDTGTPILGSQYMFKAFVLADFSAFFLSIFSTMVLIYSSNLENFDSMERAITRSMRIFTLAVRCMVLALALGLCLVLAPIGNTAVVVFAFSVYLFFISSPLGALEQSEWFRLARRKKVPPQLLRPLSNYRELLSYLNYQIRRFVTGVLLWSPFIIIFLFALM